MGTFIKLYNSNNTMTNITKKIKVIKYNVN